MKKFMLAAMLALAVAAVGCKKEQAAEPQQAAETAPVNIFEVQTKWVSNFALGGALGPDGKVAEPKNAFAPGEPIVFSAEVKDAPPASAVQLRWAGPNGTKLGEEMKGISAGQTVVSFQAPDTAAWAPGAYEAQLWVVDEKVNTQKFEIIAAAPATDTAKGKAKTKTKK
ncbi:MAG TPA: hypothetical protein VGF40_01905 [Thermoanaerobaculia bacterium]